KILPARRRLSLVRRIGARKRRGAMLAGALCLAGAAVWSVAGGHADDAIASTRNGALNVTAAMGFSVQEVVVRGRQVTWRDQIWEALEVDRGDPILDFDVQAARQRL